MRLIVALFLFTALAASEASADFYTKGSTFTGGDMEVWQAKDKKREQSDMPMVGTVITITRLDKGVQWTIDPKRRIYEEKPLAVPYEAPIPENENIRYTESSSTDLPTPSDEGCTAESRLVPEKRTFAGFEARGYHMGCAGQTGGMTTWTADSPALSKMQKETEAFTEAQEKAQYAHWPRAEKKQMEDDLKAGKRFMKNAANQMMMGMSGTTNNMPKGVAVAIEGQTDAGKSGYVFALKELSIKPIDGAVFDLPADYRKVSDVIRVQTESAMEDMGIDVKGMNQMLRGMGAEIPTDAEQE